jgi:hypothetical protein
MRLRQPQPALLGKLAPQGLIEVVTLQVSTGGPCRHRPFLAPRLAECIVAQQRHFSSGASSLTHLVSRSDVRKPIPSRHVCVASTFLRALGRRIAGPRKDTKGPRLGSTSHPESDAHSLRVVTPP